MDGLFTTLLIFHVLGGSISFILGLVLLLTEKGTKRHKLLGKTYLFSMLVMAIIAIPMSYIHPNLFLFTVSIFTIYMLITGRRYLNYKKQRGLANIDIVISTTMLVFGIVFLFIGLQNCLMSNYFGVVHIIFGLISLLFVYQDYINLTGKSSIANFYLIAHLQRFIGSYVASVTAFLVVNNTFIPNVMAWLLPTICLVPLISIWTRKYRILK